MEAVTWACPAELFARWVAALKSGKYPWELDCLRTDRGFHPVGVLLDVIDPGGWHRDKQYGNWLWHGQTHFPPPEVQTQYGFTARHQFTIRKLAEECMDHGRLAERLAEAVTPTDRPAEPLPPPPPPKRGRGGRRKGR